MAPTTIDAEPAPVALDLEKTALIVIDMQRDSLEPGGFGETPGNDVSRLAVAVDPCRAVLRRRAPRQTRPAGDNRKPPAVIAIHCHSTVMELSESGGEERRVATMFSKTAANNRNHAGEKSGDRADERHVAIKVDSVNWKMFILGGAIACVAALQPTVELFEPSTVRSVVFVGGIFAIVAGLRLRRRFNCFIDRKVQGIIAQFK
jgi:hypothetical protein